MSVSHKLHQTQPQNAALRVAVSACLVGQKVRYDGSDKRHRFVADELAQWVELIPVCPEVEIGLGVPRPPIQVVEESTGLRAVGVMDARLDVTHKLNRCARSTAQRLYDIDGYIFKARSPSCGVASTPIHKQGGGQKKGAGLFAAQVMARLPLLPVVEERVLDARAQQINFIQRLEAYRRWRLFCAQAPGLKQLWEFHRRERLSLMAHGAEGLRRLDRRMATLAGRLRNSDLQDYGRQYMQQFTHQATRRRHVIVLRHIAAQCRASLGQRQYSELRQLIDTYAQGEQPPGTLLIELNRLLQNTPLAGQRYLEPGLALRLHPH